MHARNLKPLRYSLTHVIGNIRRCNAERVIDDPSLLHCNDSQSIATSWLPQNARNHCHLALSIINYKNTSGVTHWRRMGIIYKRQRLWTIWNHDFSEYSRPVNVRSNTHWAHGQIFFPFSIPSEPAPRSTRPPFEKVQTNFSSGVKRPGCRFQKCLLHSPHGFITQCLINNTNKFNATFHKKECTNNYRKSL